MSNRWNQALYRKIDNKKSELQQKEELNYKTILKIEELEEIRNELQATPLIDSDEEFERLERKIEDINTEDIE